MSVTGSTAAHSSLAKSAKGEGVQYRDADDNGGSAGHLDPAGDDPNISGTLPFDTHAWEAGKMSGFQDNADYCEYMYNVDCIAESRLHAQGSYPTGYSLKDGDYDDNGGYPVSPSGAEPHNSHNHDAFGSDESAYQGSNEGFTRR